MSIRDDPPKAVKGEPWPERTWIEGRRVRTAFRVRYGDTDQMGMAYYANYLTWFEVMRGDLLRAIGQSYRRLEEEGYLLPIVEAHVRYLSPARYDDPLEVVAWLRELGSRKITFEYRVEVEGRLLATGWTTHIPIGRNGRPRPLPLELRNILGVYLEGHAENPHSPRPDVL